jgi:hypothetical protein
LYFGFLCLVYLCLSTHMGLQDLNEELYKREGMAEREKREDAFDPLRASQDQASSIEFQERQGWTQEKIGFFSKSQKAIRIGAIAVGVIALIATLTVMVVKIRQAAFTDDRVTVKIEGPSEVGGSQLNRFVISYSNTNRADLENAEMLVYYPETFRPEGGENMVMKGAFTQVHIGTVAGHSQGKIEFPGKFYGSKGSVVYLRAVLRYKPSSASTEFQTENQLGITVQSSSLAIDVQAPLEVASDGKVEYRVDYINTSDIPLTNIRMKATYPSGFRFEGADPKTSEGEAIWYLGNLAPGQKGAIQITGSLEGVRDEAKVLKIQFGTFRGDGEFLAYSEAEKITKIIASPLRVIQSVNGLAQADVNPGDVLYYTIRYRNEGQIGLRDVILTVEIQGAPLDFARLRLLNGAYDSSRGIIRWKASDIAQLAYLAPGQGGEISFSVPVLSAIPMKSEADKNFRVVSVAKIDSPDVPTPAGANKIIGSNTLQVWVNSAPMVQAKGFYQDGRLPNTGPVPPKVGVETSYTLHWIVTNTTNDVDQVQVTASLPTGVKWLGKTDPTSENLVFNERTNQVTWNIGSLSAGVGNFRPAREVAFQVSITPESALVGREMTLLNETVLTAHDLFTKENLRATSSPKTTSLLEDDSLPAGAFQVTN